MVCRTSDKEWLRSIATHPRVWHYIAEDGDNPDSYEPDLQRMVYLRIGDDGYVSFRPFSKSAWEMHICTIPKAIDVDRRALDAMRWMCERGAGSFVAKIAASNKAALRFARRIGFDECGRLHGIVAKGGGMVDLVLMEWRKWKS